jgi:hypothetical protein
MDCTERFAERRAGPHARGAHELAPCDLVAGEPVVVGSNRWECGVVVRSAPHATTDGRTVKLVAYSDQANK